MQLYRYDFMVRQLTEKAIKHNTKQLFVFVDLRKAYDFVPCVALWIAIWEYLKM